MQEAMLCDLEHRRGRRHDPEIRVRVMVAATQAFLDRGYESATVDAIARSASTSKVTIYRLFPDKRSLFFACMTDEIDRVFARSSPAWEASGDSHRDLFLYGVFLFQLHACDEVRRLHRALLGVATEIPELSAYYENHGLGRLMAPLEAFLRQMGDMGVLRSDDWPRSAQQFHALFSSMPGSIFYMQYAGQGVPDVMAQLSSALDLFLAATGQQPAAPALS